MTWNIEHTDEFGEWWDTLSEGEQEDVVAMAGLLEERGPTLPHPYSSSVEWSRHSRMRELRIQHAGDPFRILYAFNPLRTAILLIGGNKVGDSRWYKKFVPIADDLYDVHLEELRKEGLLR